MSTDLKKPKNSGRKKVIKITNLTGKGFCLLSFNKTKGVQHGK